MGTSILLVDDHRMMRDGLRALLEQHDQYTIVGEASDGRTAVEMADSLQPDIVVMDISMPKLNGVEATRKILADHPHMKIIALSMHADRRYVMQMLDAGASGYLIKNSASEDMVRALGIVVGGQSFLSPAITDQVIHVATDQHRDESAFSVLTNREREVLQLLAEGRSSKEIAAELYLSVKTIEARRRDIMNKLDIHNVAALTRYAIREGITTAHL